MISKGTTHNNGVRLANYMVTGKEGERAELWQLRGFEATNIKDAFRDIHIMANAGKCQQPFFHVQVRNRDGEELTREQWEHAANRIEKMLGLGGQPRAIAFHTLANGNSHMHVAWSRIREDDLTAVPLPFFKQRLKKLSRELELEFALEPVTSRRPDDIRFAPTRAEQEQAHRLGLDIHEIRNTIRGCYERSDCGASFQAALEQEGYILAQGERRDFVVIDHAGGLHALGKRVLDESAAQIRERLADLERDRLPTVAAARDLVQQLEKGPTRTDHVWDRDLADRDWQNAIIDASIEKDKGPKEKEQEVRSERPLPEGVAAIRLAYSLSETPQEFVRNLDECGFRLARVTPDDASKSHRLSAFSKDLGRFAPEFREGEFVTINERGHVYRLDRRSTGESREAAQDFMRTVDDTRILGVEATQRQIETHNRAVPGRALWTRPGWTLSQSLGRAELELMARETPPEHLKGHSAEIWTAYQRSDNARAFVRALEERGFIVASVTRDDAANCAIDHFYKTDEAKLMPPKLHEGDFVAVAGNGRVHNLYSRTTGDSAAKVRRFMAPLDGGDFGSVDAALEQIQARAAQHDVERRAFRDLLGGNIKGDKDPGRANSKSGDARSSPINQRINSRALERSSIRAPGKILDAIGNAFESLFAPVASPEQRREAEVTQQRRVLDAEGANDLARYAEQAARQREEAERRQDREREGGGRER